MRLLHAGRLEVLQDHRGEVLRLVVGGRGLGHAIDELVVLVDAEHTMRRQALDRERPGDPHLAVVRVRLVVEVLEVRLRSDGGVDLLLARDTPLPPLLVQGSGLRGPRVFRVAGDLPLLPRLAERRVQLLPQRLQLLLEALPDRVDLGVVGDGPERDVRHPLVNEALADVADGGRFRRSRARDLGFLLLAVL